MWGLQFRCKHAGMVTQACVEPEGPWGRQSCPFFTWRIWQVTGVVTMLTTFGAESMPFASCCPSWVPDLISCSTCFLSWQWSHFIKCQQATQWDISHEQGFPQDLGICGQDNYMLQFITLVPILNTFPVTSISQRCPYSKPSSCDYCENDFGSSPQSPSNIVFVLFYYFYC